MNSIISAGFFDFFKQLAANNNKDWFDANRKNYEINVKIPFENLVDNIIVSLSEKDKNYAGLLSRDCIFRINRDIRFSKDKTPYKLNRSAIIAPGGRKNHGPGGFYFEIGPGDCSYYAGAYAPEKSELYNIRMYIVKHSEAFRKIIKDQKFIQNFKEVQGEKNKRIDSVFASAAEEEPLIYNNQFYIRHDFQMKDVMSLKFTDYLLKIHESAKAFNDFMIKAASSKNMKSEK